MTRGIDTAAKLTAKQARELWAAGYSFAGRYLVPSGWKALTKAEAEIITGAGLRLLTVWETVAERPKGGAAAGAADGAAARRCAEAIGMPARGIIYFAVDFGAAQSDMPAIEAYLRAARANTGPYEIGVYGPYDVIEYMAERQVCKAYWQCVGWSGGRHSKHRDVYQAEWEQLVAGVMVDINECADLDAAGIWEYKEDTMDIDQLTSQITNSAGTGDHPSDWAREATEYCKRKGIFAGDGDGNYGWQQPITREAVAQIIYNTLEAAGALRKLKDVK